MPDGADTVYAVPQRVVEAGRDRQLAAETQQLQRRRVSVVAHQQTIAESVAAPGGVPTGEAAALCDVRYLCAVHSMKNTCFGCVVERSIGGNELK
jgi:hypothetical protein